ncbi:MAG: Crp/Fnr family transcriptional regulator [Pseudomonadota bacterium]
MLAPASPRSETASPHAAAPGAEDALSRLFGRIGRPVVFERDEMLAAERDRVGRVYLLLSGVVRSCICTEAGERQIFAFARPGDLVGFPDLDSWHCDVEACCTVRLLSVAAAAFNDALLGDPAAARAARARCVEQLRRRERHLVWLTKLQSEARVLAFLTEFAGEAGGTGALVPLPLTRQEIGDHLGMTMETVCRSITSLRRRGVVETDELGRFRLTEDARRERCAA